MASSSTTQFDTSMACNWTTKETTYTLMVDGYHTISRPPNITYNWARGLKGGVRKRYPSVKDICKRASNNARMQSQSDLYTLDQLSLGTRAQIPTGYMVKTLRAQSTYDSNVPSDQILSIF